nr:LL-diaminopimelate aminotransferase [Klebsiella pneumoniae]
MACRSGRRTISCRILTIFPEVADKAGLVVLNYPHNPTGALATPALFASALQFARRHRCRSSMILPMPPSAARPAMRR